MAAAEPTAKTAGMAAGEGPALLQGCVVRRVGQRMTVRYHRREEKAVSELPLPNATDRTGNADLPEHPRPGRSDQAIGQLLLELMTPMTLNVASPCNKNCKPAFGKSMTPPAAGRNGHATKPTWHDSATCRSIPGNRLVADALEADWNEKLRTLTELKNKRSAGASGPQGAR